MIDLTIRYSVALAALAVLSTASLAHAAEGGADYYGPGTYGDFGMAVLGEAGLWIENLTSYAPVAAPVAVNRGLVHLNPEQTSISNSLGLIYVTNFELFGGRYFAGLGVPVGASEIDAVVAGDGFFGRVSDRASGLGDLTVLPIGIGWKSQSVHVMFYEQINVPVGEFNPDSSVSLSLNYWAFDTNVSVTWSDDDSKLELDLNLGLTINTTNRATDYRSGNGLHLDYTLGWSATSAWSFGLGGYYYDQVTGDSGSGAVLGPFEGRAYGVAPVVSYGFGGKTPVGLTAKWVHDLDTADRLEGDYAYLALSISL